MGRLDGIDLSSLVIGREVLCGKRLAGKILKGALIQLLDPGGLDFSQANLRRSHLSHVILHEWLGALRRRKRRSDSAAGASVRTCSSSCWGTDVAEGAEETMWSVGGRDTTKTDLLSWTSLKVGGASVGHDFRA